jgi:hypothetical protein
MWTCPVCKRVFKRTDQPHSCKLVSSTDIFKKRPPVFQQLYAVLINSLQKLGDYREEAIPPDTIFFKSGSSFLGLKLKKNYMEVEFFLDHREEDPSISKFLQTSKNRYVHVVPVSQEEDLTPAVLGWIHESYFLISKKELNK